MRTKEWGERVDRLLMEHNPVMKPVYKGVGKKYTTPRMKCKRFDVESPASPYIPIVGSPSQLPSPLLQGEYGVPRKYSIFEIVDFVAQ